MNAVLCLASLLTNYSVVDSVSSSAVRLLADGRPLHGIFEMSGKNFKRLDFYA